MQQRFMEVNLSKGMVSRVCECHYHLIKNHKWHITGMGYAARTLWDAKNKKSGGMEYLHRIIAGTPKGMGTDHIDGNKLDNFCWNLRIAEQRNNNRNRGMDRRNTSGYKGVSYMKQYGTFRAYIRFNDKAKHLGCFKTAVEGAIAYNQAAIELYGPYARLNVVAKPKA